jgi:hypothetical protein
VDRYVMRHPATGGVAMMPESSVEHHRDLGWVRVSDAIPGDDAHRIILRDYADATDLDAIQLSISPADPSGAELLKVMQTHGGGVATRADPDVPANEPVQDQSDQQADPAESEE